MNIASFPGVGQLNYVLNQIGIDDPNEAISIIDALSHKNVHYYESDLVVPDNQRTFSDVLTKLQNKYNFVLHAQ